MPAERQSDSSPPPHTTSLPTHRLSRAERTKIGLTPRPSRIEQLANAHPSDETDDATLSEHFSSPSSTDSSLPRSPELTKTSTTGFTTSKAWADMTEEDLALQGPPRLPTPTWADGDDVRHAPATRDKLIVKTRPTSSAGMRQRPSTDSTLGSPVDLSVFKNRPFIRSSSESQAFPSAQQRQTSNNVDDSSDEGSPSVASPEPQSASSGPPDTTISQQASPAAPAKATLPATSAWDEPVQSSPLSGMAAGQPASSAYTPEWHPPPIMSRNAFLARPLRGRGRGRGSSDSYRSPYAERPFISQTPRHLASSSSSGWRSARPPQPPVDTWDEAQFPPLPTSSSAKPAAPLPPAAPSATQPPAGLSSTSRTPLTRSGWQQDSPQRQNAAAAATTHMRNERGEWTGWGRGGGGYSGKSGPQHAAVPKQHHPLPPRPSLRSRKPELSSWDDVDTSPQSQPQSQEEQSVSNGAAQQADDGWGPQHPAPEPNAASINREAEGEERSPAAAGIVMPPPADQASDASADVTPPALPFTIQDDAATAQPIQTGHATLTVDSANSNDRSSIFSLHSPSKNRRGFPWQSPFSHAIDTNDGKKVELKQTRDSPDESFVSQFDEGVTIGDRKAQRYLDPDMSPKASRFDIGSIKLKLSSKEGEESADEEIQEAIKRRRKRVTVACQTDPRQEEEQVPTHHVKQPSAAVMPVSPQQPLFVSMHESHRSLPTGFAVDANNYLYGISGNPVVGQWPAHSAQYFQPPMSMIGPGFGGQAPAVLQQYATPAGPIDSQQDAQHLVSQPQYVVAQKPNASAVQLRQLLTSNGEGSTAAADRRSQVVDDFDPTAVPPSTTENQAPPPPSGPSLSAQPQAQPYLATQQPATDATTEALTQAARRVMEEQIQSHPAHQHQHQAQQPQQPALAPASALQPGTWTWTGPPPILGAPYYAPPYQAAQGDPAAMPPAGSWVPATEASEQAQDGQDTVEEWVSGPVIDSHPSQQHAIAHHQQHHYSNASAAEIGYPFASPEWGPLASGQPPTQTEGYVPYPRPPQRSPERAPSAAARGHHRQGAAAHATSWRSGSQQQQQYTQTEAAEHDAQPPPHPTGPRHGQNAGSFNRPNYQHHHHHSRPPPHHHQQYAHQQHQQNFIPTSPTAARPPTQPAQHWQHQPQQPQQGGLPARPPPSAPTGPAAAAVASPQAQHQYYIPPHMQHQQQHHHQFQPYPTGQPYYSHHTAAAPPLYPRAGQGKRGSYSGGGGSGGRTGNEASAPAVKAVAVMQEGTGGQQKVALQLKEAGVGTGEG